MWSNFVCPLGPFSLAQSHILPELIISLPMSYWSPLLSVCPMEIIYKGVEILCEPFFLNVGLLKFFITFKESPVILPPMDQSSILRCSSRANSTHTQPKRTQPAS